MYEECFSEGTRHMSVFGAFMIGRLPELAHPTIRAQVISLPERQGLAKKAGASTCKFYKTFWQLTPS
jgi:hypothetical protein